jgi:pSer/pThr/pTyr-binding forkhead associated (FHA) protein
VIYKLRDTKTHQAMPIPDGSHTVGREEHNYICVPDQSVSRRHAQVTNTHEGLFVEDLGSSNGTAVRGDFITKRTQVNIGDVVFFGSASFRVEPEVNTGNLPLPAADTSKPAESKPAAGLKPVVSSIQFAKVSAALPPAPTPKELPEGEMVPVEESASHSGSTTLRLPKLNQLPSRSTGSPPSPQPLPAHLGVSASEPSRSVNPASSVSFPAPLPVTTPIAEETNKRMFSTSSIVIIAFLVGLGIGLAIYAFVLARHV